MRSDSIHYANLYTPFRIVPQKPDPARGLSSTEGVADRLRLVTFAELQARDLFRYGAERFVDEIPAGWADAWNRFSVVEDRHAQLLLDRMAALGVEPGMRTVSDKLTRLCRSAEDPILFLFLLASAEERGMEAGRMLGEQMRKVDPVSSEIFAQIAREEVEHVESARAILAPFEVPKLQEKARSLSALL